MAAGNPQRTANLLDLVEAAYDLDAPHRTWLRRLADLTSLLVAGGGVGGAYTFDYSRRDAPSFSPTAFVNAPRKYASLAREYMAVFQRTEPRTLEDLHVNLRRGPVGTLSEQVGIAAIRRTPLGQFLDRFGCEDAFGCVVADPEGHGVVLSTNLARVTRLSEATRKRWTQLGAHVAAAARLRRRLSHAVAEPAIVHPSGRVVHAEGEARGHSARERLRDAVRAVDAARSRKGRAQPDESLALWKGLVAGRWSLIERFDSDGRRYFVARRNDPEVTGPFALTRRERQVVAYAAMGHSLKLIAYELGLGVSTVSEHRSSAMRKLGVRSTDLAALLAPQAGKR